MKVLAVLLLAAFAVFAIDTQDLRKAGFSKLSESQKAELIKQIEQTTVTSQKTTPQVVDDWVNVGVKIGQALGGAARELGMAVNEFAATPAGKLTVALVVWKVFGTDVIHIFGGVAVLIVFLCVARRIRLGSAPDEIQYDPDKVDIFKRSRVVKFTSGDMSQEALWGYWGVAAIGVLAAVLMWCSI